MIPVTAPEVLPEKADLFLAGGISNCPDWQVYALEKLADVPGIVLNPRRSGVLDPEEAVEQITWEYEAFKNVKTILFWFPEETLCPITLFELGRFSHDMSVKLFVGTHPNYQRKVDVVTQLGLARNDVEVVHDLDELVEQAAAWLR